MTSHKFDNGIIYQGDCLELMKSIPDDSVDMVLADLPYGYTEIHWDNLIPFEPLWKQYWRVLKAPCSIVLFCQQPFTSQLILSCVEHFKYTLVWEKSLVAALHKARSRFLGTHEDIAIFSKAGISENSKIKTRFNPQGTKTCYTKKTYCYKTAFKPGRKKKRGCYIQTQTNYPKTILRFNSTGNRIHPTQKPGISLISKEFILLQSRFQQ